MRVEILHKYKTYARREARENSTAREDGRSIFIKRYPGNKYHIIMVYVTEKQRALRDMFAYANKLAKEDMKKWNRVRHWSRFARKKHISRAYRAAVSFYYKMLKEGGGEMKVEERDSFKKLGDVRVFRRENVWFLVKFEEIVEEDIGVNVCGCA
ncbi:MAG: hypothetical protein Q4C30_10165 [Bacteroidia bacterium]|nr:hypothetical protein [Bacteroidia bacterium]